MVDWRFLIFSPKNNFLAWKAEFNLLWWLTLIFAGVLIWFYYFITPFKIRKNRTLYWLCGFLPSLLWMILAFLYLQFIKPIQGSVWQDAASAAVSLFIWLFVIWYVIVSTIPRYLFGWFIKIKLLGNGFLHKRKIPW
jgi:hypothetical protein